jgi:nitroimidazol reductase NimA-like FMN-containing flavoprotein (pyridoxamine 5'-phosphate oxidase superfamily)
MGRYHLRRREKEITDEEEMRGILGSGRYATVALCSEGEPYVVTMNYGYDVADGALYFHCSTEGLKLDFIRSNDAACATVIDDLGYRHGECDHAYRSVVVRGKIEIIDELDGKKKGLGIMLDHLERDPEPIRSRSLPDDASYSRVCVLRLDIEEMTGKQG